MKGLTVVQARELQRLTKELWMLLSQEQYEEIMQIFKKAVDEEIAHQEDPGAWI